MHSEQNRTEQVNVCEQELSSFAKRDQDWLLSAEESPWNTDPLIEIAASVFREMKQILIKTNLHDTPRSP